MSGISSGINYSLLFPAATSSTVDASSAILTALYSGSSSGSSNAVSTGNPLTDLKLAQKNQTADVALEAKQPEVAAAITNFTKAVANAKTISDALANPYVQQVLLTAKGLSSYIGQTALVQKAFLSDPSSTTSLVSKLKNSTLTSAVQTYNFAKTGLAELQDPKIQATLTNAYAEVQWRKSLDKATPGLSNALTFLGQASSIKTPADVVNDTTNFDVITTVFGIPQQIVNQSVTAVNQQIAAKLDFTKLQDPNYVTSLTDQYLLIQQQNAQSSTTAAADSSTLTSLAVQLGGIVA